MGKNDNSNKGGDMSDFRLRPEAALELDEVFSLRGKALDILAAVVFEWESDPMSVQCFDLRMVEEAKRVDKELRKRDAFYGGMVSYPKGFGSP